MGNVNETDKKPNIRLISILFLEDFRFIIREYALFAVLASEEERGVGGLAPVHMA